MCISRRLIQNKHGATESHGGAIAKGKLTFKGRDGLMLFVKTHVQHDRQYCSYRGQAVSGAGSEDSITTGKSKGPRIDRMCERLRQLECSRLHKVSNTRARPKQ